MKNKTTRKQCPLCSQRLKGTFADFNYHMRKAHKVNAARLPEMVHGNVKGESNDQREM